MGALSGRVAIVTGASKGLGRSIARQLASEGAKVALVARSADALAELAAEIGEDAAAFPCDLRSPDAIRAAMKAVAERFGGVDILINNAVMCLLNSIETVPDEDVRCEIETNLMGPIFCVREVVPLFRARGGGDIVNISSDSVKMPFPMLTIYAATKAGLETFSDGARAELKSDGVRVTVFRSGYMEPSASQAQWSDANKAKFYESVATTGDGYYSLEGVPCEVQARVVTGFLSLPREATVEHLTVRSTR